MADENGASATDETTAVATEAAKEGTQSQETQAAVEGQETGTEGTEGEGQEGISKDDWRTSAAGDNKDLLKLAKRYGSMSGVLKALADSKAQLSKGTTAALAALPEDATEEQKAEWRKSRDIPESADKYDLTLKGVDWTDDDKAILGDFTKAIHSLPVPVSNAQAKGILQWYADTQVAKAQEDNIRAERQAKLTEKALKSEYGGDYDRNVGLMKEFGIAQLGGQEAWDAFVGMRMADGTILGDNPAFIRLIVDSALDRGDGMPFIAGGATGGKSDADIIKAHKETMAKAAAGDREAKAKIKEPDYDKQVTAAYERQARRDENKRAA